MQISKPYRGVSLSTEIALRPELTASVRVVFADDTPAGGARIWLSDAPKEAGLNSYVTSTDGHTTVRVPPPPFKLNVVARDGEDEVVTTERTVTELGSDRMLTIRLAATY